MITLHRKEDKRAIDFHHQQIISIRRNESGGSILAYYPVECRDRQIVITDVFDEDFIEISERVMKEIRFEHENDWFTNKNGYQRAMERAMERSLSDKQRSDGWRIRHPSPAEKSDSGNFVNDCVLMRGATTASKVIGVCLWIFFLVWLIGMAFIFWVVANGYLDQV